MKKKEYVSPRVCVYEVELQPILAGSETGQNADKGSFNVSDHVTSGDDDDVWE